MNQGELSIGQWNTMRWQVKTLRRVNRTWSCPQSKQAHYSYAFLFVFLPRDAL